VRGQVSENNPSETVRKGSRVASEAFILDLQNSEVGLLGPVSSTSKVSARGQSRLFGQSLSAIE
jgi:hypothetical protein